MQLTVLMDNNTLIDRYFLGEPGLSFFIEENGTRLLFDTGYSDAYMINAHKMQVNLLNLDYLILSHGHLDHTWGIEPLIKSYTEANIENIDHKKPILVTHPLTFAPKTFAGVGDIGMLYSSKDLSRHFQIQSSTDPIWLTDKLVYLGQIERTNDFEGKISIGKVSINGHQEADYLLEDSALAYKSTQGIVVITGCSHAGICNIIEKAKQICQDERVLDVIGGFHLLDASEQQLQKTVAYFAKIKPKQVHACHCTDLKAKIALARAVNVKEVGVGLKVKYE